MSVLDTILYYQNASINLYCIGGTIVIVFGTIGGFFCLCIFGQKSMRKNPGSIYLIVFNISNILLIWIALFPIVYRYMTNHDLSIVNLIYCRFNAYLLNVLLILGPYYLVLAAFDRTLVTSRNALTRQKSTIRSAFLLIATTTVFWLLFYIHVLCLTNIQSIAPGVLLCFYQIGIYSQIMSYFSMILGSFLPCLLMGIFGIITMRNFRQARIHAASTEVNTTQLSLKDRQLIIMLLSEISISITLQIISSVLFVYTQRMPTQLKTIEQQSVDNFLLDLGFVIQFVLASLNFYINVIVSKSFRKKISALIWNIILPTFRRILRKYFGIVDPSQVNTTAHTAIHVRHTTIPHQ